MVINMMFQIIKIILAIIGIAFGGLFILGGLFDGSGWPVLMVGVSWTRRMVVRDQAGATPMEGRRPISPVVVFRRNRRRSESSARAAGGRGHGHT